MPRAVAAALAALSGLLVLSVPAANAGTAPAATTGRLLVTLRAPAPGGAHAAAAHAVAVRAGGARVTRTIPQLRAAAITPRAGRSARALADRLRADPAVASVRPELRFALRHIPNDPVFTLPERGPAGTVGAWWALRQGLPDLWDVTRGDGARVAIVDTGIDATHPELADRIAATADFDDTIDHGPATIDEVGHGTHVASLACADTDNGVGIAGAGGNCDLLIAKSDLSESSVAKALVWAADHGAQAINMSFGADGHVAVSPALVGALRYAADRGAVLVAAAADEPVVEQGAPANVLQPTGTGADVNAGLGLTVTAASNADDRASFAGRGSQISLAAYGSFGRGGPSGILGAFPAAPTLLERGSSFPPLRPCRCRSPYGADPRYAHLAGTSMAAPMVAAVAALMRQSNPDLPAATVVRLLKQTARRPSGTGWNAELGWGILDAGPAIAAARAIDARPPRTQLLKPRVRGRSILLRWRGQDPSVNGVAASGIARYEVWRAAGRRPARRIKATTRSSLRLRGARGQRYAFYVIAVDHAGNREAPPAAGSRARVRVRR